MQGTSTSDMGQRSATRRSLQTGMDVVDSTGAKLGRVWMILETVLEVRPHRRSGHAEAFLVPIASIVGLTADEVRLGAPVAELRRPLSELEGRTEIPTHTLPLALQ